MSISNRNWQEQEPWAYLKELNLLEKKGRNLVNIQKCLWEPKGKEAAWLPGGLNQPGELSIRVWISFLFFFCLHFLLFSFSENWLSLLLWFTWKKTWSPSQMESKGEQYLCFDSVHGTQKLAPCISGLLQNSWERAWKCPSFRSSEDSRPNHPSVPSPTPIDWKWGSGRLVYFPQK